MASDFLKNLQKTVDSGEFNSEAAKKINELTNLVETKNYDRDALDKAYEELKKVQPEIITEEEAASLKMAYDEKMLEIKKQDAVNAQIATLIDIEDIVKASIADMFSFIDELDEQFTKEFEAEDPFFGDLHLKIEQLKSKYKSLI